MSSYAKNIAKELPSMASMGFYEKCAESFPYHPAMEIMITHFESKFEEYIDTRLVKVLPHFEEIKKRWWRRKFVYFIRSEYRKLNKVMPQILKQEDDYFENEDIYGLKPKWQLYKIKVILKESKRDRFGNTQNDFEIHLQKEWFKKIKYKYMMRELGLRQEPFWRHYKRAKTIAKYAYTFALVLALELLGC